MTKKRDILALFRRDELLAFAREKELAVTAASTKAEIVDALGASHKASLEEWLLGHKRERLKEICGELGLSYSGARIADLVDRILGRSNSRPEVAPAARGGQENTHTTAPRPQVQQPTEPDSEDEDVAESSIELEGDDDSSTPLTTPFNPAQTNVVTKPLTIDSLVKRIRYKDIDLVPEFQRQGGLWDKKRMSRLIESLLIRIPLPVFYFDGSDDNNWLVVDGLQRLTTFDRFLVKKDLKLQELEYLKELEGKGYDELPRHLQRRIEETQVTAHIIQAGTPPEVKYNIFRRINTGGLVLNAQEIRHALNQGPATEMLKRMAAHESFLRATANGVAPERMLDRECALRFLAFVMTPASQYKAGNLDLFLTQHIAQLNRLTEEERRGLEPRFYRAMHAAADIFGDDAFRKPRRSNHGPRSPINKGLFETWSVALDQCTNAQLERLVTKRAALCEDFRDALNRDREFYNAITLGTGDVAKVCKRFETVERIVRDTLADA